MLVKIEEMNKEEVLVVSSRDIADDFEKEHKNVMQSIQNLMAENSAVKTMFFESTYTTERGREYPEYLMTRDGFSLLVMGFTGQKALDWKLKYIRAFNEMEKELKRLYEQRKQWEIERAKGVLIRHVLTDTIKMKVAESPNKKFAYPNYTKLIYQTMFGKPYDTIRAELQVKPKETLRDYMTGEQLKELENLEMLVSGLIGVGMGYAEIKNFIRQKYTPALEAC